MATKTTVTGTISDASGNVATSGTVVFTLQPDNQNVLYSVIGTDIIAPQTATALINPSGQLTADGVAAPFQLWGNPSISPANTTYSVTFNPGGIQQGSVSKLLISGTTYDLSNPVFAPIVAINPQSALLTTPPLQQNLIPGADAVFNLGAPTARYANLYAVNVTFTNLSVPGALNISGNVTFGGTLSVAGNTTLSGNLAITGPSPFADVTANGAACDGVTNDTNAFNTLASTLNGLGGGTLFIPPGKTCLVTQLNWAGFVNVRLLGLTGTSTFGAPGAANKPKIIFTSASSPLFNLQSTFGVTIEALTLQYNNAGFSGLFIDTSHNAGGTNLDTNTFSIHDSSVVGTPGTAVNATCGVCMDKTIDSTVHNTTFGYMVNGIRGLAAGGSYSINNQIIGNQFSLSSGGVGSISGAHILNPGQTWKIVSNDFEFGLASGAPVSTPTGIDATIGGCINCSIDCNFFGDMPAGYTGTVLKNLGTGGGPVSVIANNAQSGSSNLSTFLSVGSASAALVVKGNLIFNYAVAFAFGGGAAQVDISDNVFQSVTAFSSGSAPSSGQWIDNANAVQQFGTTTIQGATSFTQQITGSAGSAATPSYSFPGAGGYGLYFGAGVGPTMTYGGNDNFGFAQNDLRGLSTKGFRWCPSTTMNCTTDAGLGRGGVGIVTIDSGTIGNAAGVIKTAAVVSGGAAAAFTGSTGACATTGTQSGGSMAGRVTCTAATAASTLVIVPGTTAPNGWICTAFDQTTRANLLQQTATTTTNCTLTATSITQNDVIVFQAIAF